MSDQYSSEAARLSAEILKLTRDSLMVSLRFMDMALCQLTPVPFDMTGFASDGSHFYYETDYILKTYLKQKETLSRDYLHSVLHWVFHHPFAGKGIDRELWNLACDLTVENLILELGLEKLTEERDADKRKQLETLNTQTRAMTAEILYRYLKEAELTPGALVALRQLFFRDGHQVWYMEEPKDVARDTDEPSREDRENRDKSSSDQHSGDSQDQDPSRQEQPQAHFNPPRISEMDRQEAFESWQKISDRVKMDLENFSKAWGDQPNSLTYNLSALHRETYDYSAFLKRFAVLGEEMEVNEDEYDYIFYTYGLQLYKNVPLIEPLEYKETPRVREFVIAIDTSGSCSGTLVQAFLNKTYNLLKQSESFFSKINLHILQCDDKLQQDAKITSQAEFDQFLKTLELLGEGGTDFRPVFRYVETLMEAGEFENLKGLIYFTDGFGTYPKHPPGYDTAFVFLGDELTNQIDVPPWAIKLVLEPEALMT